MKQSEHLPPQVTINVIAVNDAPLISGPASYSLVEDTEKKVPAGGWTVTDVDAGSGLVKTCVQSDNAKIKVGEW